MNSRTSDILLGTLFFAALIGLGFVTVALSDLSLGKASHEFQILSRDVGYLRPGDPLLLHGLPSGKVLELQRLPEARSVTLPDGETVEVRVALLVRLDEDLTGQLPSDSRIIIEDRGLLGGKLVRIESGTATTPWPAETPLVARLGTSAFQAAGDVIAENRDALRRTLDNLAAASESLNDGTGTLGLLISDEALAADVRAFAADARLAAADLRRIGNDLAAGQGTLGKLFSDDALHERFTAIAADMAELTGGVRRGEGALGKLFNDPEVAVSIERLLADSATVAEKIASGEGTLGRLVHDPYLWNSATGLFDDLAVIATDIRAGEGLLGTLIRDQELASDFRTLVKKVLGAVEDARETSPVQGVGSFLFGTF